jgi:hypothetical protein
LNIPQNQSQNHNIEIDLGKIFLGVNVNRIFSSAYVWSLALGGMAVIGNQTCAIAQTTDANRLASDTTSVDPDVAENLGSFSSNTLRQNNSRVITPIPGSIETSSQALIDAVPEFSPQPDSSIAQADIDIGGPTRGVSSYVGAAANIGISGGSSSLADGNFMVISKIGLTKVLSVRPGVVFGNDTVITVPVTYDLSFKQFADPFSEPLPLYPYVGAGAAFKTGSDSRIGFLLSGGVDVPLTRQFTANLGVNAAFFNQADIGLTLGVGYNFGGF